MVRGMLAAAIERGEVADLDPDALANVLLRAWAEATIHVLTTGQRHPPWRSWTTSSSPAQNQPPDTGPVRRALAARSKE